MEDSGIIDLYWARDERALTETEKKYGAYCRTISRHILKNEQDVEECVNDAYVRAWNAMPPQRPFSLRAFLGKIVRNLSLSLWRAGQAQRRGGGQTALALEELKDCVSDGPEEWLQASELAELLDRFLRQLPLKERCLFLRRYWYLEPMEEIAYRYHMPVGSVKSNLHRTRKKLQKYLEKEDVFL